MKIPLLCIGAVLCLGLSFARAQAVMENTVTLQPAKASGTISKDIYGQSLEQSGQGVCGSLWVGRNSKIPNTQGYRNDVLAAIKELNVPVIRWPGGCCAETYHWKDGIGTHEKRRIGASSDGTIDENAFGTHEFMNLCEMLGCDAYVCGNLGSGSVQEMCQWIEYISSSNNTTLVRQRAINWHPKPWKLKYFGIGNESWDCGGGMTPEYYADMLRQYGTFCRNAGGRSLQIVACGPNENDSNWTKVVMKNNRQIMDCLSLHYFVMPKGYRQKSSPTQFNEFDWLSVLTKAWAMDKLITDHVERIRASDPRQKVSLVVDGWGMWYVDPDEMTNFTYQQNTLRDAMVAAITLNIFNRHADDVKMANIVQLLNVGHALILTKDDKMVLTPTYHVFRMFKGHQNAMPIPTAVQCCDYAIGNNSIPALSASASRDTHGLIHVTLANLDPNAPMLVVVDLSGSPIAKASGEVLTGAAMHDFNDFDTASKVAPARFKSIKINDSKLEITLPPKSIGALEITLQSLVTQD